MRVRRLRHWKQRFDPGVQFIWRRAVRWHGKLVKTGDKIPKALAEHPTKLRRFWESGVIELANFEAPNVLTGRVKKIGELEMVEKVTPKKKSAHKKKAAAKKKSDHKKAPQEPKAPKEPVPPEAE